MRADPYLPYTWTQHRHPPRVAGVQLLSWQLNALCRGLQRLDEAACLASHEFRRMARVLPVPWWWRWWQRVVG